MRVYEYECLACKARIVDPDRLEEPEEYGHSGEEIAYLEYPHCGPLKRVWSAGFNIKSVDWGH